MPPEVREGEDGVPGDGFGVGGCAGVDLGVVAGDTAPVLLQQTLNHTGDLVSGCPAAQVLAVEVSGVELGFWTPAAACLTRAAPLPSRVSLVLRHRLGPSVTIQEAILIGALLSVWV